ncbi:MAG: 30S ribosomal protein S5 [Patescibacteria group bacterium]
MPDKTPEIKKDLPAAAQVGELIAEAETVAAVLETPVEAKPNGGSAADKGGARGGFSDRGRRGGGGGKRSPRGGRRPQYERVKPEFDQKIIDVRRVARVVAGGRRFNFSVAIVIGDRKGSVGVGTGKAGDTSLAIEKAMKAAKKNLIRINFTKTSSIPHEVSAKYSSARVFMFPNRSKGLVAGSSVRNVLDLAGVRNVTAKVFSGSKNKLNNARAAIAALMEISERRGVR